MPRNKVSLLCYQDHGGYVSHCYAQVVRGGIPPMYVAEGLYILHI